MKEVFFRKDTISAVALFNYSGVTEITSVRFEPPIGGRDQARELAMKAAYEKAKAMAGAVGQSIGRAISIIEVEPSSGPS
ncbi:MAG: SIMPL domain-containing protein [Acidobacteria bacterium]|nr:SIMPL domain-containing protein [Acidobacteriota bacterium]